MQDPKFEQQVQQKMEELAFVPSEGVWTKVDAEINRDRKRRMPLFWLFLFLGLSLAGAGYLMFGPARHETLAGSSTINATTPDPSSKKDKAATIGTENTAVQKLPEKNGSLANAAKQGRLQGQPSAGYGTAVVRQKIKQEKNKQAIYAENEKGVKEKINQNQLHDDGETHNKQVFDEPDKLSKKSIANATDNGKKTISPDVMGIPGVDSVSSGKTKPAPVEKNIVQPKAAAKVKQPQRSGWHVGITAGAGISSVSKNLFKSGSIYAAPNSSAGSPAANPYSPSAIKPGFAFTAGFFLKKSLTKRASFSTGLNYRYYSTEIHTGRAVDSIAYVFSSPTSLNGYYRTGNSNSYINRYHFVELPVSMSFQLNNNKRWPISWDAGLSVLYLINSNGLHYDAFSGIYYKNNSLFNKTQFSASTALMIGLPGHGNSWQVGPQLQYGFTDLLHDNSGNKEHLFFAGIKLSRVFGKK